LIVDERFLDHPAFSDPCAGLDSRPRQAVLCAGILVADVFASPIPRLPDPGELTTTSGLVMAVGGSAANTAIALRILGQEVSVAGKVGADALGDFVISELRTRGVGTTRIRRTRNYSTSGTVVLNVKGEDRRYLHCIGANAEFRLEDLDLSSLEGAKVLYFGGFLALPSFTSAHLTKLLMEAKSKGLTTVVDVTMPSDVTVGIGDIAPTLRYTDYFLPNFEEAAKLTGKANERCAARCLSELNPDCAVVITRGPEGAIARRRGHFMETPRLRMDSVDESGAGDAFAAGLITGVLEDWDLEETLLFAAAVGASSTRALGCCSSVFSFEEAVSFLERQNMTGPRWDTSIRAAARLA
jgi:sugar/nucleoside kinase (ribokinase family)